MLKINLFCQIYSEKKKIDQLKKIHDNNVCLYLILLSFYLRNFMTVSLASFLINT